MRLLSLQEDGQLSLTNDIIEPIPPYAILSHTWGKDEEEVNFQDLTLNIEKKKNGYGYRKIEFCGQQAAAHDLRYFWVDTCCINKTSSAELQEAITSMFRWYQNSTRCYVYLPDVQLNDQDPTGWESAFRKSRWFTRGWTLQELLAPSSVEFFDKEGHRLGDKVSLQNLLHEITGISIEALQGRRPLSTFSVSERFLWARGRDTKRKEDKAYSLWGIFSVSLFSNYGEGEDHAMRRLRLAIEHPVTDADSVAHCVVPLGRNRAFVGRDAILDELMRAVPPQADPQDCQRVAIEGLGGIGKTQIALEVVFRLQEKDPNCSVFWVPAVSQATLENGYRNIGRALKLPGIDNDKADVKALVAAALSKSTGRWCLIIDNIDDTELLSVSEISRGIGEYLPFSPKGSILLTTRNHEITTQLDISLEQTYSIDEMSEDEALKMLATALKPKQMQDIESTRALLDSFSYLPLAIKQAIAYMSRTGVSTKSYLEHYRQSDSDRITLLSRDFEDRGRYRDIANPIATTWLISFSHIEKNHPLSAEYLKYMCFMAEKDIPRLRFPFEKPDHQLDEAIGILLGYSFITERDDGDTLDMHRLVRLVTRNSIGIEADCYIFVIIAELSQLYPIPNLDNRDTWMKYLPHAEVLLHSDCLGSGEEAMADLFWKVGKSLDLLGRNSASERMLQHSFTVMEKLLGPNDLKTIRYKEDLALTIGSLGRYKESEQILRHVLDIRQQELGPAHPLTLQSMRMLAATLHRLGYCDEAEKISQEGLQISLQTLGITNENTLSIMTTLASNFQYRGKHGEAEQMHRRILQTRQEKLGPRHFETLHSMHSLAMSLLGLERYNEAETLLREVCRVRSEYFGPKHPSTLIAIHNLTVVLDASGQCDESECIWREKYLVASEEFGAEHPETLGCLNNLGYVLMKKGKSEEAAKIFRQVASVAKKILGPAHPNTLDVMANLAQVLVKLGRYTELANLDNSSC